MSRNSITSSHLCITVSIISFCLLGLVTSIAPARAQSSQDPVYVFHTTLGNINVQLFPDIAPQTVANFLNYVNAGDYTNSLIHRSVPNFIIQGGGYQVTANSSGNPNVSVIPANPPVVNEFHLSNVRGTIAMAKLSGDPNSATSQWFFNEIDNSGNLDHQNGGFTVFGRITDSASLAVMDAIAAAPVYNEGSPFDQLPLIHYTAGQNVQISNLVLVNSISPAPWHAISESIAGDGSSRLLWVRGDGGCEVWSLNAVGTKTGSSAVYGPLDGWTVQQVVAGPDNSARLLWINTDGRCIVWTLNSSLSSVSYSAVFGPFSGWSAKSLATGSDNSARLLWTNTNGSAVVWLLDSSVSHPSYSPMFGPFTGWSAGKASVGPDGGTRLLWNNVNGQASLWNVALSGSLTHAEYGPFAGWTATDLATGPDNGTRLLWNNSDGRVVEWMVNSAGTNPAYSPIFGSYAGWNTQAIAVGPDGNAHILWDNTNQSSILWTLNNAGNNTADSPVLGPP